MKQRFSLKFSEELANQISFKTINSLAYQIYSQFCFDVHYPKRNIDEKINDIANKNKKLFDAHVKAGFTEEQALQIIVAFINH